MTLFSIALTAEHSANVTIGGVGWNLLWVTIGNIIGGAVMVGVVYWFIYLRQNRAPELAAGSAPAGPATPVSPATPLEQK